jgi:uncharacterized membrane protein YgdD (TMEM256/DUF423 family)
MSPSHRFPLLAAGVFGATGVGLGAFGAHALRAALTELGTRDRWETAVFYQLVHTVALLGAAVWLRPANGAGAGGQCVAWAARCWAAGVVLFSGGLYVLAVTTAAPLWFKIAVPPLGGTSFIAGWLLVAAAALAKAGPGGEK